MNGLSFWFENMFYANINWTARVKPLLQDKDQNILEECNVESDT